VASPRYFANLALADPVNAAGVVTFAVAGIALIVAAASWRALLRTGNRSILYVAAGFAVFALKSTVKGVGLVAGAGDTYPLELAFSLLDLLAVALIAWPLWAGRQGGAR
jgi:hypothetical protein